MQGSLQMHSAGIAQSKSAVRRLPKPVCQSTLSQQQWQCRYPRQQCQATDNSIPVPSVVALAAAAIMQTSFATGAAQSAELQQMCNVTPQQAQHVLPQQQQQQQRWQQQQQQQQWVFSRHSIADIAGLFDGGSDIDPFTLYGTNFKKYQIEQMQGEKVVSRQRGFTVDSCVSAIAASEETPEFNGLAVREKVQAGEGLLCKRAVGPDLKTACKQSCASACTAALAAYEERLFAETGYRLEPKDRERVLRNCRHSCAYECTKSGTSHDFVVTYRR